eukprot:gene19318-biopygen8908
MECMRAPFTKAELEAALRGLKNRKAAGPDGVANEMLLHLSAGGREAMLRLYNASWGTGTVPREWREAEIVALLKKDKDPHAAKSYRPVSLTSCVAKLMERLVRNRVMYRLFDNSSFSIINLSKWGLPRPEQPGFRTCRSTEEQLALISQWVADGIEQGNYTLMLAIDFTAAFDRARRTKFLRKVLDKGIPPLVARWFQAFLVERVGGVRVSDMKNQYKTFWRVSRRARCSARCAGISSWTTSWRRCGGRCRMAATWRWRCMRTT